MIYLNPLQGRSSVTHSNMIIPLSDTWGTYGRGICDGPFRHIYSYIQSYNIKHAQQHIIYTHADTVLYCTHKSDVHIQIRWSQIKHWTEFHKQAVLRKCLCMKQTKKWNKLGGVRVDLALPATSAQNPRWCLHIAYFVQTTEWNSRIYW